MIVRSLDELEGTSREVECPDDGFTSFRYLLESDKLGFTLTQTVVHVGTPQLWHYKNHMEACLCIEGRGILTEMSTGKVTEIKPNTMYAVDNNDVHTFEALEETVLICVFSPALRGRETHDKDGSYV